MSSIIIHLFSDLGYVYFCILLPWLTYVTIFFLYQNIIDVTTHGLKKSVKNKDKRDKGE